MSDFFAKLADILGVDEEEISPDSQLQSLEEWDSLGTLTVVSMVDDDYHVTILSEEIAGVQTAGELWELVQSKSGDNPGA